MVKKRSSAKKSKLIVYDSKELSFSDVIESFMTVCDHSAFQAEQCAILIHEHGKFCVKEDTKKRLEYFAYLLVERGFDCDIETEL